MGAPCPSHNHPWAAFWTRVRVSVELISCLYAVTCKRILLWTTSVKNWRKLTSTAVSTTFPFPFSLSDQQEKPNAPDKILKDLSLSVEYRYSSVNYINLWKLIWFRAPLSSDSHLKHITVHSSSSCVFKINCNKGKILKYYSMLQYLSIR